MKARKLFFKECHLAGRQYWDVDDVWDELHVGTCLELKRDLENRHDVNAVAVVYHTIDEQTGETYKTSKLKFFNTCINIIRTLPIIQHDEKNANDVAKEPHEFTHAPDALRGFCIERTKATKIMTDDERLFLESQQQRRKEGILGIAGAVATRGYMSYGW